MINNSVFEKALENVRKHRDITLVTTERRRNYLVSEPNYSQVFKQVFAKILLATEMIKTQTLMNKYVWILL